ncbi:MAG: 30S ribosomal protein S12 methylthiotransferase RimO, partial [Synergistales bacterium]|nr:30S ribosomal protein S12 methylthiotransferase RimO [Synergistales bacterium]
MKTRDIRDGTRIFLLSLGCAKNQVDSELLAGRLEAAGMELVSAPEEADVALINSCGFIQPAVEESLAAYFDLEELKMQGKIRQV